MTYIGQLWASFGQIWPSLGHIWLFNIAAKKITRKLRFGQIWSKALITYFLPPFYLFSSATTTVTPLTYTILHQTIFRYMNVLEFRSESKLWAKFHGPLCYTLRALFVHSGCILQFLSLFTTQSIIELSTVLFVSPVWINISTKDIVFTVKKRKIIEIWQALGDDVYKAKTPDELKWVVQMMNFNGLRWLTAGKSPVFFVC